MRDYTDRYGDAHPSGSESDLLDAIAVKLLKWGFARPVADPDPVESAVTTAAFAPTENAAPHTVKRAPGRPRHVPPTTKE